VPVIELAGMTEAEKRAYVIADNKLALNAGWDDALLALEMRDLQGMDFDLGLLGFDTSEIDQLLAGLDATPAAAPESSAREVNTDDYQMAHRCPRCQFEFDDEKA